MNYILLETGSMEIPMKYFPFIEYLPLQVSDWFSTGLRLLVIGCVIEAFNC